MFNEPALEHVGVHQRGGARIAVVVDAGFVVSIEPGLETIDYPCLARPSGAEDARAHALETVIAEKFQAMVALGRAFSRMKDSTTSGS